MNLMKSNRFLFQKMEDSPDNQSNSMSDSNKLTRRLAGGAYSTTPPISASNCSVSKTSIVYEYDESVKIKEEVIEERHRGGEHNLLSEKSQLNEKCTYSGNKSAVKTEIVYEYDENLEIKEEIIQDLGAVTGQKLAKKCESTWNAVDTVEVSSLVANKLPTHKQNMIQDQKPEPEKKYKCEKCARSYKYKRGLNTHQKFECGLTPQFVCKFCGKQFRQNSHVSRHIEQVHRRKNSNQNQELKQEQEKKHNICRHQKTNPNTSKVSYNCDICSQSYSSLSSLHSDNRVKHAAMKPQFACDICGYKTNKKCNLSKHISSCHFKNSKSSHASYNCNKCFQRYSSLSSLEKHDRLKHTVVKPEFTCDVFVEKTSMKSNLTKNISSRHFEKSKTLQARHNCGKCSQSYSSVNGLHYHNLVKHAGVAPEFTCYVCGHKTDLKSSLARHIYSHHCENSKMSQAKSNSKPSRARYNCDKCSKSYSYLTSLQCHKFVKHIPCNPPFLH